MAFLFRKSRTTSSLRAPSNEPDEASQGKRPPATASPASIDLRCLENSQSVAWQLSSSSNESRDDIFKGLHILLAEDDEVVGELFCDNLISRGALIQHVLDGNSACSAALEQNRPSVILMDCQMPVMDGFAAAQHIRTEEASRGLRAVPIIALTALAREFDQHHSQAAGINAYLVKPVTMFELGYAIEQVLKAKD
ncbi:MAG: response regulator [Aquabacterium sp.]|uniref:response regulator n=1 Tax=Aquabacterium sp. TaxID=1872578 RepID=UPI003BB0C11B